MFGPDFSLPLVDAAKIRLRLILRRKASDVYLDNRQCLSGMQPKQPFAFEFIPYSSLRFMHMFSIPTYILPQLYAMNSPDCGSVHGNPINYGPFHWSSGETLLDCTRICYRYSDYCNSLALSSARECKLFEVLM
jgi:hypothetical protein